MKTNQLMKREIDGYIVTQRTDNSYLNATDILQAYNENAKTPKRLFDFLKNSNTKEFMESVIKEESLNNDNSRYLKNDLFITTKGKMGSTYMHPYLFIKFSMWLSTDWEVKVIKWVYDNLIKVRHEAGDYYLEMTEAIHQRLIEYQGEGKKIDALIFIKEANYLKQLAFGYQDKTRNEASEQELKLLSALQKANIMLIKQKLGKDERWIKLRDFAKMYS